MIIRHGREAAQNGGTGGGRRGAGRRLPEPAPLAIQPNDVHVPANGTHQFTAAGGVPPYRFIIAEGYGGTIDEGSGLYRAPGEKGKEEVAVVDSAGHTDTANVHVQDKDDVATDG